MKSSSKRIISTDETNGLAVWKPDELAGHTLKPEVDPREMLLEIFKSRDDKSESQVAKSGVIANPDKSENLVTTWEPDGFDWAPEVGSDNWRFAETTPRSTASQKTGSRPGFPSKAEVTKILQNARQQAAEITSQAEEKAEEILSAARIEANNLREESYRKGWVTAKEEAASTIHAAQEVFEQVVQWREEMFTQSEKEVVCLMREITQALFADGYELPNEILQETFNRAVERARGLGDLKVFINPRDAEVLDPSWKEFQSLITGNKIQVIPSEGIKAGGCFIQGQAGTVDARMETGLQAVMEILNTSTGGEG